MVKKWLRNGSDTVKKQIRNYSETVKRNGADTVKKLLTKKKQFRNYIDKMRFLHYFLQLQKSEKRNKNVKKV